MIDKLLRSHSMVVSSFDGATGIVLLLLLLCQIQIIESVVARPFAFQASQKDGTPVDLLLKGDHFCNWLEDQHGNVIVKADDEDFYFARENTYQGKLVPSAFKVGIHDPKDLELKATPRPRNIKKTDDGK
mmetsp:Transcript_21775/g.28189  ORF Transcript_21775/g.28189 Transcript_21775/m.28189 type:complete len:130 (-) Transcript_21775:218-607(-)